MCEFLCSDHRVDLCFSETFGAHGLGRWFGVKVRLHLFFLLFATFTFYLAWRESAPGDGLPGLAIACIVVLFFSVLIHEAAHCLIALRLGGSAEAIVIAPLGGLRPAKVAHDPQSELLAVLAGPMASLAICLSCLSLVALYDQESAYGLLNPLAPQNIISGAVADRTLSLQAILRLTCWINWWLVVINIIPAFPFDGGRAFLAFLQSVRPSLDRETGIAIVATCARFVAVILLILAVAFHDSYAGTAIPSWLPLVLLAIFVFFGTRVEESVSEEVQIDEAVFGYDFSQGYTSLERSIRSQPERPQRPGPFSSWLRRRQELRETRRQQIERDEDQLMDEILQRMHSDGYDKLSQEDLALLKRVSARFRSRTKR